MAIDLIDTQPTTLLERLIQAADHELAEHGSLTGRFEAVAHRAGVSRATAYRQIGSVAELVTQVGLRRAHRYIASLHEVMGSQRSALAKLEAAMIYGAQVLPEEPVVMQLIARQFSAGRDPEVYQMVNDLMRPTILAGQRAGELRDDVDVDCIIDYLVEQSYLATHAQDRSTHAVRRRFRTFMEPAIIPQPGDRCGPGMPADEIAPDDR